MANRIHAYYPFLEIRTHNLLQGILSSPDESLNIVRRCAIHSSGAMFHSRVKHLDVKWHYLREVIAKGHVTVQYVPSHLNVADAFTKALERKAFQTLRGFMGMRVPAQEE